jgi:hypothetical protein
LLPGLMCSVFSFVSGLDPNRRHIKPAAQQCNYYNKGEADVQVLADH